MSHHKSSLPPLRRVRTVDELTRQNIETISKMERATESGRGFGDRVADAFARIVGSWTFIIAQSVLLAAWVVLNIVAWSRHWDPYPFIFLNLALSFQAAYASPIIMMSQNRQAKLSDRRNHLDLQVNLLAEQENTEMLRLLQMICKKLEIPIPNEAVLRTMEQQTRPADLADQIDQSEISRRVAHAKHEKHDQDHPQPKHGQ